MFPAALGATFPGNDNAGINFNPNLETASLSKPHGVDANSIKSVSL